MTKFTALIGLAIVGFLACIVALLGGLSIGGAAVFSSMTIAPLALFWCLNGK